MKDLTLEQVMQKHSESCTKSVHYRLEADACIAEMKRRLKGHNDKITTKK